MAYQAVDQFGPYASGTLGKRSDAHSRVGSPEVANSALANSDMDNAAGLGDSDNSYAELQKLH